MCKLFSFIAVFSIVLPSFLSAQTSTVLFQSNWGSSIGNSRKAITDGGKWQNYWEFNQNSDVQLVSVVEGGPAGENALKVLQRGSIYAANLQINDFLPPSRDYYLRFYFKNEDTSKARDHIVTVDTWQYPNLTFIAKRGGESFWDLTLSTYGCGYTYPVGHWSPEFSFKNNEWYRFEYFIDFIDSTHIQVYPRIYDKDGKLILTASDFHQEDYDKEQFYAGKDDWTLESFYQASNSFCVNPEWVNDFGLGNNGQQGSSDTGKAWYFAGIEIRTDKWPGPISNDLITKTLKDLIMFMMNLVNKSI